MTESHTKKIRVERVQTGVRIEKRMLKVLKALAEYLDMSLGDLLEGIVLHAFEGKPAPLSEDVLERIKILKQVRQHGLRFERSPSIRRNPAKISCPFLRSLDNPSPACERVVFGGRNEAKTDFRGHEDLFDHLDWTGRFYCRLWPD